MCCGAVIAGNKKKIVLRVGKMRVILRELSKTR